MRVLDYGCGPGDFIQECSVLGIEAVGVDNSDFSLEIARGRGLKVFRADYRSLPDQLGEFDLIFLQSVVEHVHHPVELIRNLKKYLKESGVMVVSAPTPGCYFWDDPTHIRPYTPKSFRFLADLVGLQTIEVNYVATFLLGMNYSGSLFYRVANVLPLSIGSNLIVHYKIIAPVK
jgi:2-polyprenyl-3-methyl-5-hydroxy-6-metoxy-1,4-benzoquinol methylase